MECIAKNNIFEVKMALISKLLDCIMIVQLYAPKILPASRLDSYMSSGWFRSSYMLYRSEVMCISEDVREVINIRLHLDKHTFSKSLQKILKQNGKRFEVKIQPLALTEAHERLYQQQKGKFKGFIFDKLAHFFHVAPDSTHEPIFETYEVGVYEGDKLVAVSFFDVGKKCLVSLLGLYDMAYSKYSLGIYTMLLEIQHGQETARKFYYPGYIISGDSTFDYKLKIGNFQYYDWRGWWRNADDIPPEGETLTRYRQKMQALAEALAYQHISSKKILYPFFSFGYLSFGVRNPSFYSLDHRQEDEVWLMAGYSAEDDAYMLAFVRQYMDVNVPNMTCTADFYNQEVYCMKMLDYDNILIETSDLAQLMQKIAEVC